MIQLPILLVEDDSKLREAIVETLHLSNYEVDAVSDFYEAIQCIKRKKYSLVITDVNLSGKESGIELLESLKKFDSKLPVVIITAFGTIEKAVESLQKGASHYLVKPFIPESLISVIERFSKNYLEVTDEPICDSPSMKDLLSVADRVSQTDVTVLITGESGTGKEVIAKYIHNHSKRCEGEFIAINCAAIPEQMLESMLFGYEKGAYTGAYTSSVGKFEQAQGGTIFLDEISEMPINLQAKILRVLQEKEVERLGGKKTVKLDVRILAATNRDLKARVEEGLFREDLYFRLNVFPLYIPPLRERVEDIIPIALRVIEKSFDQSLNEKPKIMPDAVHYLQSRKWPGNIRELENNIQRALILCENNEITQKDLTMGHYVSDNSNQIVENHANYKDIKELNENEYLKCTIKDKEYQLIAKVLTNNKGRRQDTATELGISTRTLRYKIAKMKELGFEVPGIDKNVREE